LSLALVPMIAGPPEFGSFETDWIPSITDMDAAIADLQSKASEFGSEMFNAYDLTSDAVTGFNMAWNQFVADLADLKDALWFNRWQRRSDIVAMRQRFNDLVARWHRLPGAPAATSTPTFKPEQISPPSTNFDSTIKWAAIGLVAIAGISALAQLSPAIKQLLPKGGSR
jgi:hypothetical protein